MTDDEPFLLSPRRRESRLTILASMIVVCVVLTLATASYSMFSVAQDRDGWRTTAHDEQVQNADLRTQLDQGIAEIACRSRANFATVEAASTVVQAVSKMFDAMIQGQPTDSFHVDLVTANAALTAAFAAQNAAIPQPGSTQSSCSKG